jgi:uncharacterized membrane protein (UPF0127 family)
MKPLAAFAATFLVLCGCGSKTSEVDGLNTTEITFPNGKTVIAETKVSTAEQMLGMMFRDSLAKDRGMLFINRAEENVPYWMYQVRIPLDIIWMDHQRRIVEISANTPACTAKSSRDCPSYGGHEKARYVLELAGGGAAMYGLKVGDTLTF